MKTQLEKDYSFIEVGSPVVPRGKREVVYIIEILGDNIITTNGSYKKEQLSSVIEIARIIYQLDNNKN
tara:strand:- start:1961 stop:2164 length:204 start_codon:yes stop_codon:yes gene_type:complete